jgi:hypothetical protein
MTGIILSEVTTKLYHDSRTFKIVNGAQLLPETIFTVISSDLKKDIHLKIE